ncbi:MAG: hypothetical protein V1808_01450 [Candidatus Daviesbacteria bacterium]
MESILIFILGYLIFFIFWLVFVLLFFALSFITKKNLVAIPVGLTYLISFGIQLFLFGYAIYILWQLITNHEWLFLIFAFIFGGFVLGFWGMIYEFLLFPFKASSLYFLEKVEGTDFSETTVVGEILDKDNKVVDVSEGETSIKTRFAKYFLAVYTYNLVYLIISPGDRSLAPFDYVTTPFFQIISLTFIIGIPYGIYRRIKYKAFFTKDKRYFFIQTWKISLYIFIPLSIILYLLAQGTNTL